MSGRHVLTSEDRAKGARTSRAAQAKLHEANLRRWHVENGHEVEDATPEERAIIEAVRERISGT